ncbi:MAG: hypothetical protein H7X70_01835 [Candidatus Kapabacteria bacterium]|nr:hypothetical protein [Candidatus Kapabacteria bacterium]
MGSYVTKKQSVNVAVTSGTNPIGLISLDTYYLTLTSNVAPSNGVLPRGSYQVTAAAIITNMGSPDWNYPFGITADQPIQVGTTPDE